MKRRIVGVALASSVLAVALFALPLAFLAQHLFLTNEQGALERTALRAAIGIGPEFATGDPAELPASPPGDELGLYDRQGRRVSGTGPAQADPATLAALGGGVGQEQQNGWLIASVPVPAAEQVAGAVRAASPASSPWRSTALSWLAMTAVAAGAVAISSLIAWLLARRVSSPLVDLADTAEQLGEGHFDVRTRPSGIAEIDTVGTSLNQTAQRLGDLVDREREIAANASHQLRTPLTGLRATLESALADPSADMSQAARDAIAATDRLEATVTDLIGLTRGHEGPRRTVDLATAFDAADQRWRGALASAGRPLRVASPQAPSLVTCSPPAITRILDVLLENALLHGAGIVTVAVREADVAIAIDVSDEGGGLDPATDIFTRGVSSHGSSGIGLALARRVAEDQGGRLHLTRTTPDTRFTVLLNRAR